MSVSSQQHRHMTGPPIFSRLGSENGVSLEQHMSTHFSPPLCAHCGGVIERRRFTARYCSGDCRLRENNAKRVKREDGSWGAPKDGDG